MDLKAWPVLIDGKDARFFRQGGIAYGTPHAAQVIIARFVRAC